MESQSIYQSPENNARELTEMSDMEIRAYYAQDEICVNAVGWFYQYFGSLLASLSVMGIYASLQIGSLIANFFSFTILTVAFVYIILGWGMRHLDPWSRTPSLFAAIVMMVFVPAGTLAGIVCFYLLKARSHADVFSNKYRGILLSDPSQDKKQKILLPLSAGALTAISVALVLYLLRTPLTQVLELWK